MIKANNKIIPSSAFVHESNIIECDHFEVGENAFIGPNNKITCKKFVAGDYLFMTEGIDIGRGGCTGPNSEVIIGRDVGIFEGVVINPSEKVEIGNNVGIGSECLIWTHGAWLDITQGFPADFGPVKIGSNVWFPARSIMMPNTSIGDNTVIASMSLVNKNIPSGSLAGGVPIKIIKENLYPKFKAADNSNKEMEKIIFPQLDEIIRVWSQELAPHKGIKEFSLTRENYKIILTYKSNKTVFETIEKKINGDINDIAEDFRDFLRRRGVKIFTGKPFKSIKPLYLQKLSSINTSS